MKSEVLEKQHTGVYISNYIWKGFSFLANILSMYIVMPKISSNVSIYGIYSICTALTIFLGYADLGFITAGVKYASIHFSKGERKEELGVISFSSFILFILLLLFSLVLLTLSFNPVWLIKDLPEGLEREVACKLLLILAIFGPTYVFQRMLSMIYEVRMEHYIFNKLVIAVNIIKIISTFYFFTSTRYDIVGYYLLFHSLNVVSYVIGFFLIKRRYNYDLKALLKSFRFSPEIFKKVRNLAFSSFYITIIWIFFNELDLLMIGRFIGKTGAAYFGVAIVFTNVLKFIYSTIYSPILIKMNYFAGHNKFKEMGNYLKTIFHILNPLTVFPVLGIVLFSDYIVLTLYGEQYTSSIFLLQCLSLSFLHSSISYIAGNILVIKEDIKKMYVFSSLQLLLYWLIIIPLVSSKGEVSFAVAKVFAWLFMAICYLFIFCRAADIKPLKLLWQSVKRIFFPLVVFLALSFLGRTFLPIEKSRLNFLLVFLYGGAIFLVALVVYLATCQEFRDFMIRIIQSLKSRSVKTKQEVSG